MEQNTSESTSTGGPVEDARAADGAADGTEPDRDERADEASAAAAEEAAVERRPRRNGLAGLALVLAVVLALLATTVTGFLWWQYRQFYVSLDAADAGAERGLESARASIRRAEDRIEALAAMIESDRAALAENDDALERLSAQLAATGRRIDALQGGSYDARAQWLRSEAEYYLATANTELTIGNRWENAISALELADRTLTELADPGLAPVREAIAAELIALRAVRLPDIEGLVFSLDRLAARVPELPLRRGRQAGESSRGESSTDDAAEPGLARLWLSLKRALASIVRVERSDEPVPMRLSAEESRLVREQVGLELELAQIAALRTQPQTFAASLDAAIGLLRRDFDAASNEVEGAIALLEQTQALEIAPAKPDISESLRRLRAAGSGAD